MGVPSHSPFRPTGTEIWNPVISASYLSASAVTCAMQMIACGIPMHDPHDESGIHRDDRPQGHRYQIIPDPTLLFLPHGTRLYSIHDSYNCPRWDNQGRALSTRRPGLFAPHDHQSHKSYILIDQFITVDPKRPRCERGAGPEAADESIIMTGTSKKV